jgi:hypothetical protein
MVIVVEVEITVSGSGLTVTQSSQESVTISGSFEGFTFSNPYSSPTYHVIGINKEYIKSITFEGNNIRIEKQDSNSVTLKGEIKVFRYKTEKGTPFQSYVVLPCEVIVAQLEEFL